MKLIKKGITLFDGSQTELLKKSFSVNVSKNQIIRFDSHEVLKNYLSRLRHSLDFDLIKDSLDIQEKTKEYFTKQDLRIYLYEKEEYVLVLSCGEFQPARFILILEAIVQS